MKKVAIIGGGIAGSSLAFWFNQIKPNYQVDIFSDEKNYPACSLRSTAQVALFGAEKGKNIFSDLVWDSFVFFEHFVEKYKPEGVFRASRSLWKDVEQQWEKESAYLIEPAFFLDWLKAKTNFIEKRIESHFELLDYDFIFYTTGAYFFPDIKPVSGTFIEMDVKKGTHNWSLEYNHFNLIVKESVGKLYFGVTNHQDSLFYFEDEGLKIKLNEMLTLFKIDLPEILSEPRYMTGVRAKGPKRLPICRWENSQVCYLGGLYKNAWSFAPYLAHQIVQSLKDDK